MCCGRNYVCVPLKAVTFIHRDGGEGQQASLMCVCNIGLCQAFLCFAFVMGGRKVPPLKMFQLPTKANTQSEQHPKMTFSRKHTYLAGTT